ncbi:MSC_0621 family F1-like ATPase epsilon subunit [Metamycoplasma hyosynoviae]|uniref:Uncharacterized protein n=1 Tax=Metamycoplasma hyosynoviae TaxID=29559 RepID=A0A063YJ44_9BACT|nr:hypothetical protein [Metamycoplasma hyosynoviae]KDE44721.1 hypothetical protein NPL4_03515 [Metamycoplasma hyosynoviae]MDC8900101.1 hypothetical protein [Metamycoplasma hyosynoviae]MDC8916199.1 hypothetical protein [Metamycoplasma hyosynoviae]MDC8916793.1 hypothetical protein [Metamycoplasma hyosynoviae]MDC8919020.1 hypothetical protein [Metamycoplasma hyosynoviae]
MDKKLGLRLEINFIGNKSKKIDHALVYINVDDEDDWKLLDQNMIGSYKNTLIKINDLDTQKNSYIFLKNTNFVLKDNLLKITSSSELNIYSKTKQRKEKIKSTIKNLNEKIGYYHSLNEIGLDLSEYLELVKLEEQVWRLKMEEILHLKKGENNE